MDWSQSHTNDAIEHPAQSPTSDSHQQPLSWLPIYESRLQAKLQEVTQKLSTLSTSINVSALAHDPSSSLHAHYQILLRACNFKFPETRTVGFIGDSGVGKSSLINSILDQRGLSRSSNSGSACTCVVTEFRHTDDTHTGPFTIQAEFMSTAEMKELLEELLLNYRQEHVASAYLEVQGTAALEQRQKSAATAWKTFLSLFKDQPELTEGFLSEDRAEAFDMILGELERWAFAGLANRPGGAYATEYLTTAGDLGECKEFLDKLMADNQDDGSPAIWPFIKLVRVYMSSPVLQTGLIMADMPGFDDLNYARVRATERYLKHQCDEVFIVADIGRVVSLASVADILRRCKPNQPQRIVCTRSEDISAEEVARARNEHGRSIKQLNEEIEKIRISIEETESNRENANPREREKLSIKEVQLRDRAKALGFELTRRLIVHRNDDISQKLTSQYEGVRVFCVSNTLYAKYCASRTQQAERYLALTGIRELRAYCQLVPAEAQMEAISTLLKHEVRPLILSLRQWALSGADSVTAERAAGLRVLISNVERTLLQDDTSPQAHVARLKNDLANCFTTSINDSAALYWDEWKSTGIETSLEWDAWHHSTYKAFCANFGTYSTDKQSFRSWNDELVRPARDRLSAQWERLLGWLELYLESSEQHVTTIFQRIIGETEAHMNLAPQALQNLLRSLESRRDSIINHIKTCIRSLLSSTECIRTDMLSGDDSSFFSGLMREAYISCQKLSGDRSDRKRKDAMQNHIEESSLFHELSRVTREEYGKRLDGAFEMLEASLSEEIADITRDCSSVVAEAGQIPEAQQDSELARALRDELDGTEEILSQAQNALETLASQPKAEAQA